jgi:Zn-dependent oligopeptidase
MHDLCSHTKYVMFHGTRVERDFVEAPSQMLENWCWESDTLAELSAHYETGEPLPAALIAKMIESKNLNAALHSLRQLFFGWYDMDLHTNFDLASQDINEYWHTLKEEVSLIPSTAKTWPVAAFGHIMGGYDAGYYGYMWSLVYSADMFYSRFKKEGTQNTETGMSYRKNILQPGASKDGFDLYHKISFLCVLHD